MGWLWILFTSASGDLVESDTGLPLAATSPQVVNVYLRDRSNATTLLVSAALHDWTGADSDCQPTGMTSDGRLVVFESTARNLVLQEAGDALQVFVRNVVSNTTVLASISTNGTWANGACRGSMITPDGRFVAFVSEASNLVEDDTNGIADVFVRDLQEGITRLVSVGAAAGAEGATTLYSCERPLITPDGKHVAFFSTATNLAPAPLTATNLGSGHIYLRDLSQTAITCVSRDVQSLVPVLAAATNVQCFNHVISDDGNWVAYQAAEWGATTGALLRFNVTSQTTELIHTNALVPPGDYGEIADLASTPDGQMLAFVAAIDMPERTNATGILVWSAASGSTTLASVDTLGQPAAGLYRSPRLDASGKRVAFASTGDTLTTNAIASGFNLYLRDLNSNSTTLLNQNGVGEPMIPSGGTELLLNAEGNLACFDAALADDSTRMPGSYVVWARSVDAPKTEIVSPHAEHLVPQTPSGYSGVGTLGVNSNGTRVVFVSHAPDLVESDTNMAPDVFVRDLVNPTNLLLSVNSNGFPANNLSIEPTMSADGRFIAFTSTATDIVPGHTGLALNVFLHDMVTGTNRIVSTAISNGLPGTANSYAPVLSKDGMKLVFFTEDKGVATNISYSGSASALVFCDLERNERVILSSKLGAAGVPCMTPDGQLIAFQDIPSTSSSLGQLVVWNSATKSRVFQSTNSYAAFRTFALDPTGRRLLFATNRWAPNPARVGYYEVQTGSHHDVGPQRLERSSQFKFSADGEKVVYFGLDTPTVGTNKQIFLYDFRQQTNLVLTRPELGIPADSNNDLPDISADGRFVAFRSCTPEFTSPRSRVICKLILHDLVTGSMIELSRGTGVCIGAPQFSGDGRTLFYTQRLSGNNDFNQTVDVFGIAIDMGSEVPLFHALLAPTPGGWLLTWPVVTGTQPSHRNLKKNGWKFPQYLPHGR